MRIRRIDRKLEKDILIGMITDKKFLSHVRPVVKLEYFKNTYARTVVKWVIDFYDKYNEPPFNEIQKIYEYNERQGAVEEDDVDLIKKLLQDAAEQYAECPNLNSEFLLEKTEEYFNKVNLETIFAQSSEAMQTGDMEKAKSLVFGAVPIKISQSQATDGLTNQQEIMEAFEEASKPLFRLPGAIGKFINDELCRDSFLALQAPEKTGKTWFLMWVVLRALRARLNVVLFEFEMTKPQVNRRLSISISGKSDKKKYCDGKHTPKCFSLDGEPCSAVPGVGIQYQDLDLGEPLTWQEALRSNEEFYKRFHLRKDKHWRLVTAPARSMNSKQIDAELERLQREEDFIADVVLVDYIDLSAPEDPREKERERIYSNWVGYKAMTNKRHTLTITVTQSNAQTYGMELQTKNSFSEDHRKYAHTNGTLGLTQTPEDKKSGVAKLNWLVLRENEFIENDVCYILQCLKRGKFCVDSYLVRNFKPKTTVTEKNQRKEYREHHDGEKKPIGRRGENRTRRER